MPGRKLRGLGSEGNGREAKSKLMGAAEGSAQGAGTKLGEVGYGNSYGLSTEPGLDDGG